MSANIERRNTAGTVELRAHSEGSRIGGYAAKFGTLSQNLGGFVETIDRAFFNKSAGDGWPGVMARYNHEDAFLLGTSQASTLRLSIDDTGLDYEVDMPDTGYARDLAALAARGDVAHSSFAFYTFDDDWGMTDQGFPLRTLLSGRLVDVAPVNTPAYMDTSSGLRSLAEARSLPVEEVQQMAARNELSRLLGPVKTVIDLAPSGQSDPHPALRLAAMSRLLDAKRAG